jgi:glycosyltransferase involved in cell wall biosynthesis
MAHIGMATHSYYLRDPRVKREAETLTRAGHSVDVVCLRLPGETWKETVNDVTIYRLPLKHKRGSVLRYFLEYGISFVVFGIWLSMLQFLKGRYDLVQIHTPPDTLVYSALLCKLTGSKVLMDLHDPMPETLCTKYSGKLNSLLSVILELQERLATRLANRVITVTDQVQDALISRGLAPVRVSVIMNFADPRIFELMHADRSDNTLSRNENVGPLLVYMGTLTRQYGVDIAIQALALLRQKLPNARLKIIGDGEHRVFLERQAASLGVADAVEFIGRVPIAQIPRVALPADFGLAPHRRDNLYDMCFPSKMYDYLALGLPVVACWTKSLEFYYGRQTVAFFESEDPRGLAAQIYDLSNNPAKTQIMARNAAVFLQKHNWHEESQRYLSIVDALLSG